MQQYYDQSAEDLFKGEVITALVEANDFDVPEAFVEQVKSGLCKSNDSAVRW